MAFDPCQMGAGIIHIFWAFLGNHFFIIEDGTLKVAISNGRITLLKWLNLMLMMQDRDLRQESTKDTVDLFSVRLRDPAALRCQSLWQLAGKVGPATHRIAVWELHLASAFLHV